MEKGKKDGYLTRRQYALVRTVAARWLQYCHRRRSAHARKWGVVARGRYEQASPNIGRKHFICTGCLESAIQEMYLFALWKADRPKFE